MAIHAMVDLETLATDPHCTVLTIGGVKFNPNNNSEPYDEFYYKLDIDEQDVLGRTVTDSTIAWWGKQDPKVQEEAFGDNGDRVKMETMLAALSKWLVGADTIWGWGYGFDLTIVEDMYRSKGIPIPYNFWQVKDARTFISILPSDPRKGMQMDLHNALADSYYQAKAIQIAHQKLQCVKQ